MRAKQPIELGEDRAVAACHPTEHTRRTPVGPRFLRCATTGFLEGGSRPARRGTRAAVHTRARAVIEERPRTLTVTDALTLSADASVTAARATLPAPRARQS